MSDSAHLLIPFASSDAAGCAEARATLALPRLETLLARLTSSATDSGDETTLSMPHERVLAREHGIAAPDGRIPWAAWQVRQAGRDPGDAAWACIVPCHWRVGSDHVAMDHPESLQLDEPASRELLSVMQPFFDEDGIALEYHAPTHWLARGELFRDLPTASVDRVVGRAVDDWLPRVPAAGALRRLQQEMQMLLYTHEVNEQRVREGLLPVNSFWVSGAGALAPDASGGGGELDVPEDLRRAALQGDWPSWLTAWRQLDAGACLRLAEALDAGRPVRLTLCGERHARTWSSQGRPGWWQRMRGSLAGKQALAVLETL